MDVCIVSTHYAPETTGNAPYAATLAEGLSGLGHRVRVVAAAPHYPFWSVLPADQWSPDEVTAGGVQVKRFRGYVPRKPNFLSRLVYEFSHGVRFARAVPRDADVILLLSPSLFASALVRLSFVTKRTQPRFVLWVQDLYSAGVAETPSRLSHSLGSVVARIEGRLAQACDRVVVIHERFREFALRELGVQADSLVVIRNWSHVKGPGTVDVKAVRERFGWKSSDQEAVVLHAGNMGAKQGLENVVEAARLAESRGVPVRFVLLGEGNQKSRLQELGRGCSQLQFIDPVPDADFMKVLAAADILLVNERPTHSEAAVPSKLTSYFAAGRPVLAATAESTVTHEELRLSRAGTSVPPDDPDALLRGTQELVADPALAGEYARAGVTYVQSALSSRQALEAFSAVLHEVTDKTNIKITEAI